MRFFKRRPVLVVILGVLLIVVIMLLTIGNRTVTAPESAVGNVLMPVENAASTVTNGFVNFFKNLFGVSDAQKENEELKQQLMDLGAENAQLQSYITTREWMAEYEKYLIDNPQYTLVSYARVSGKSPGFWFDTFLISAGRNQGVTVDMPMITNEGLVGRVIEVGGNWSKVMAVIDGSSSVAAIVERTRDNGIVHGTPELGTEDSLCTMYYLPIDNDLVPGDRILTSGLDGLFPKGILIGEVSEVSRSEGTGEHTATIKPSVGFNSIEQVIVIDIAK